LSNIFCIAPTRRSTGPNTTAGTGPTSANPTERPMSHIRSETKDRVMHIEIARTDKKNALTQDMYRAMSQALAAADADAQVRAILIHGTRDCFTAGNDLKDFLERPPHAGPAASFDFISGLPKVAKPLIAAVGGAAVGVG